MAGADGLEPPNGGIKTRCLTTWRRPNPHTSKGNYIAMRRSVERRRRENAPKTYSTLTQVSMNTRNPRCGSLRANFFGKSSPATLWYSL